MPAIVLFNKPYGVLSQFTPEGKWRALAEFIPLKEVYVAGRLDADSEGLLIQVRLIGEPDGLWPRDPPIRYRAAIPTAWLEIRIAEGKNRQVRRMTAAIGYPTLRLVRAAIGAVTLDGLAPGQWRRIEGSFSDLQGNFA